MKKQTLLLLPALLLLTLLLISVAQAAPLPLRTHAAPVAVNGQWDRIWRSTGAIFDFDCATASTCYAAGEDGLILKTTNAGDSWSQTILENGPTLFGLSARGPLILTAGAGGAVYRSHDDGLTWQRASTPVSTQLNSVSLLADANAWAAGAGGVILHSSDGGQTWQQQTSNTTKTLNAIQFIDAHTGYAAGDKGTLLKTNDGGQTWAVQTNTFPGWARIHTLFFNDAGTGWIAGQAGYIRKTTDGGQTWQEINSTTGVDIYDIHFQGVRGIFGGAKGVIATSADGVRWTKRAAISQDQRDVNAVISHGQMDVWAAGSVKEGSARAWFINHSTDGVNFAPVAGDYGAHPILQEVAAPTKEVSYVVGFEGAIGKTIDGGDTWSWQHFQSNYPRPARITAISCPTVDDCWIVGQVRENPGFVYVTHDGGKTWTSQLPSNHSPWPWMYDIEMLNAQNGHAAANPDMFYTTDGGVTWKKSVVVGGTANVEISMASPYEGWTAQRNLGHRYTTSAGKQWQRFLPYDEQSNIYFFGVDTLDVNKDGGLDMGWLVGCQGPLVNEQCPANSGVIFYAVGNEDPGNSQLLPPKTPQLQTITMLDDRRGWVGGTHGTLLYTENGGATWQKVTVNTTNLFTDIEFYEDKIGYATTHGGEILRFRGPGRDLNSYTQSTPIIADGEIFDWHYGGGMTLDADNASTVLGDKPYPGPEGFSGIFYSRWMTDTLYIMAEINDDVVGAGDAVRLALDGLNDDVWNATNADDLLIFIAANGEFSAGSSENDAAIAHAVKSTDNGWQLELSIPANLLGRTGLAQNDAVGMNLALDDGDGPGISHSLLLAGRSLTDAPATWGAIRLLGNRLALQEGVNQYKGCTDTFISRWNEDGKVVHGDDDILSVVSTNGQRYSNVLLRFDLSTLPQGAATGDASLGLVITNTFAREGFQVSAYRLLRAWDENAATWFNADANTQWDAWGAVRPNIDYDPAPLDTVAIPIGFNKEWLHWDVSAAVQYWRAHPDENFGVLLMGSNASQTMNAHSSEFIGNNTERPELAIDFTLQARPTPTPTILYLPLLRR